MSDKTTKRSLTWPEADAKWIWLAKRRSGVNQYVDFRRKFFLKRLSGKFLVYISADSDYELWINGRPSGSNQYSNWPQDKTFNIHNITANLKSGANCVAVRAYYRGEDFTTYAKGRAGLIFALTNENKPLLYSDASWRCRISKTYRSAKMPKATPQLGFTVEYDSREDDNWQKVEYSDSKWSNAAELAGPTAGYWQSLKRRPLPELKVLSLKSARLVASGYLMRTREGKSVAETMMSDALSNFPLAEQLDDVWRTTCAQHFILPSETGKPLVIKPPQGKRGVYLVFDLGCEEAGLLDLEIDAPQGTVLDIGYGEHLDDLRVRTKVGQRNFADRYTCLAGRRNWLQTYRRLGCRYIEVHIPKLTGIIKLFHLSLKPVIYPFEFKGSFKCCDEKLNDIWDVSRRTLQLCAHEHYEDCPWREQGMYAYDSRLQALYGYYTFGETRLPAACWDVLGGGMRPDGQLKISAPGMANLTIPGFSLHWISAVRELFLYSGNVELIRDQYDRICFILDTALTRLKSNGVVANSTEPDHWHFYEWTTGLEGSHLDPGKAHLDTNSFDAVYNLLLIDALRAAVNIGKVLSDKRHKTYEKVQQRISRAFHPAFWDAGKKLYASFCRGGKLSNYAQFTQAIALYENVCKTSDRQTYLQNAIMNNSSLIQAELPSKFFVYNALLKTGEKNALYVLNEIRRVFGSMIARGATSLWETIDGADSFGRAGSLCHAWSSVFAYIAGAYILGVKPLEPGFRRFIVSPVSGDLSFAKGFVPTPFGDIQIAWEKHNDKFFVRLAHPKELKPEFNFPGSKKVEIV